MQRAPNKTGINIQRRSAFRIRKPYKINVSRNIVICFICTVHSFLHSRIERVPHDPPCSYVDQGMSEIQIRDEYRIRQRSKQVELGKATDGYLKYTRCIPRGLRTDDDPITPVSLASQSKRGWDAMIVKWRRKLHWYDGIDTSLATLPGVQFSWSLDSEEDIDK
jgi:hypothetical protein